MRTLLLITGFLIAMIAEAKKPGMQNWYTGEITLLNNQILEREFRYDAYTDLLQVRENGVIKIYSARQVKDFVYFDIYTNSKRQFVSLSFPTQFRKTRMFFESVVSGEMNLIRRVRSAGIAKRISQQPDELWYDTHNVYDYFVFTDNTFISVKQFHKVVYNKMMAEYKEVLEEFILSRNLNLNTQRGQFVLINHYNILKNPSTVGYF